MPDVNYYPEVRCEVLPGGILESEFTAKVADVEGNFQFVRVTQGLINVREGVSYLPVGFVEIDRHRRRVLVELPTEADSGANRLWVKFDDLWREAAKEAVA